MTKEDTSEMVGDKIVKARNTQGLTRLELARRVRISVIDLEEIEDNLICPSREMMRRFSEQLGISYEKLLEAADYQ